MGARLAHARHGAFFFHFYTRSKGRIIYIMDIKIQPFAEEHARDVVTLMNDFRDFLISIDTNGRFRRLPGYGEYALKEELANTNDGRGVLYVALDGDKVIGFSVAFLLKKPLEEDSLGVIPSQSGRIEELYIVPEYRGKGIASAFVVDPFL